MPPLKHAFLINTVTHEHVPVQFHPDEYVFNKDNNFAQLAVPGLRGPLLQFVAGNAKTLQMELLVDTYEAHRFHGRLLNRAGQDVRDLTRKITGLLDINPDRHAPPVLLFTPGDWGPRGGAEAIESFTCVLARANERLIMFRPDGIPVRARLQVTFVEYIDPGLEAEETKRQTADYSRVHVVGQGETLSVIAGRVYENPALWRPLALYNGLDDPRHLPVGLELLIPRLPYRDPESGEVMA